MIYKCKYEIRCKQFVFTNDYSVIYIEFTKKEAQKTLKLLQDCPKYKGCELWIEKVR